MQDAALVRVVDRLGDGLHIAGGALGRQRLPANQRRPGSALDVNP